MITVTGVLVTPLNQPINTNIRITTQSSNETVAGTEGITTTDSSGNYNFNLLNGTFLVELFLDDEYVQGISVLVDNTVPSTIDLPSLLENYVVII